MILPFILVIAVLLGLVVSFLGGAYLAKRRGAMPFIARPEQWSIGIYGGSSPLDLAPLEAVINPVLTAADVTDREADFVADPFMIRAGESWHLFFEVVNRQTKRGEIALATSQDGLRWTYERVVLAEPFHLSYPYVFEWDGAYYMIPESHAASAVRLYRAAPFPFEWTPVATLLYGAYDDPSVFCHDGLWWMFAANWHDTLRLFYAEHLEGPWTEHPMSPLIQHNARTARPAGRVLVHEGQIIRFSQDCVDAYGSNVHAFIVTELTTTHYAEHEFDGNPLLTGSGAGWNKQRMHHVDAHQIGTNQWLACVDGYAGRKLVVDFKIP